MSQNQSALNTQPATTALVLNQRISREIIDRLSRSKNLAHQLANMPLAEQMQYADFDIDMGVIEDDLERVLTALNHAIVDSEPTQTTTPQTPNERQTTGYRWERDGAGYDCRVLLDDDHEDYHPIDPECHPPAGYRQVCIKCGFDEFATGIIYVDCPQCRLQVVHYCRYVAIVEGV